MSNFFQKRHIKKTRQARFGICDVPPPPHCPAYIDLLNGKNWIAVIENNRKEEVSFIPIDNCISLKTSAKKTAKRCDGMLYYKSTVIFVELKEIKARDKNWINTAVEQLKSTIDHYERSSRTKSFDTKKAYIANKKATQFKQPRFECMSRFFDETGYTLNISNRIIID